MTSQLEHIFIQVPENKCDNFVSRYITPPEGVERDTSYDAKIAFLEKTQEIFTQGKLYGLNNAADVTALTQYIGEMPTKADGTPYDSIVDMITSLKNATFSDVVSVGANNSFTVAGVVYTLHANNGELTLDPYIPLSISSMTLLSEDNTSLSNVSVEYDIPVTMTIAKIRYTLGGNENCKRMSLKLGGTWVIGTGSTADKMEEVNIEPNVEHTLEIDEAKQVTISSTTGSDFTSVEFYVMDEKQVTSVSKSMSLSISHQRAYLVGFDQPTALIFTSYNRRMLGNRPNSISIGASVNNYGWFAYPSSWGTPSMKDGDTGLGMTMMENDEWNVTDIYSDGIVYKVYRTGQLCGKAQTILLTW